MAGKQIRNRLSALAASRAKTPGRFPDGGGLYLKVGTDGGKSWQYRFTITGRTRYMGLGSYDEVPLAEARELRDKATRLVRLGVDPIEAARAEKARTAVASMRGVSFRGAAESYIEAHEAEWRSFKHRQQWANTLASYAYPFFGDLPVAEVDTAILVQVLEPIWTAKPETASRVRGRIEAVLDWARVRGYRQGDNPARWRGHLDHLLANHGKARKITHHASLPYGKVGAFFAELQAVTNLSARALELVILTACRTGEAIGCRWEELDLDGKVWTIPAGRMKGGREHRIPLAPRVVTLFRSLLTVRQAAPDGTPSPWVFPGVRGKPLSNMAMLQQLKRMGRGDITAHGFRSTFRDWAAEQTNTPRDVAEMALAHAIGDRVEAAYRRGDLFEKRRRLMESWAIYVGIVRPAPGEVVPIREARQ